MLEQTIIQNLLLGAGIHLIGQCMGPLWLSIDYHPWSSALSLHSKDFRKTNSYVSSEIKKLHIRKIICAKHMYFLYKKSSEHMALQCANLYKDPFHTP